MSKEIEFVSVGETVIIKKEENTDPGENGFEVCQLTRKKRIKFEEESLPSAHDNTVIKDIDIKDETSEYEFVETEPLEYSESWLKTNCDEDDRQKCDDARVQEQKNGECAAKSISNSVLKQFDSKLLRPSDWDHKTNLTLTIMKRQESLTGIYTNNLKSESVVPEMLLADINQLQYSEREENSTSVMEAKDENSSDIENHLPECWNAQQYNNFKSKYDGLLISNKKLGCRYCAKFEFLREKSVHVSKEWKLIQIEGAGKNKLVKQASLRKKLKEHFLSRAHHMCEELFKQCQQESVTEVMDSMSEEYLSSTCRVFNTVYSLAKRCKPLSDLDDEMELQIKNGLHMKSGLHSLKGAFDIVDFIAKEIRNEIFRKIIEKNLKICLIIDEPSTISCNPVVILFLKVEDSGTSPIIFVELVELKEEDAETVFCAVLGSLNDVGFTNKYLERNLIGFCSDGASVRLGRKSGMSRRIAKRFPNIIIWHCLNHRLQLVLDDAITEIKQVNHFKIFIEKLYYVFHQSNKKQKELSRISEQLSNEILKIGKVFGPKWAACSLRSTQAVWRAYHALYNYFSSNEEYLGLAARLENIYFLNDLALMIDILNEIFLLSNTLQGKNLDILKAEKLIKGSIKVFQILEKEKGSYEKKVSELISSDTFKKNINFVENHRFAGLPRQKLLESIVTNLKKRLVDCDHLKDGCNIFQDGNQLNVLKILEPEYWNISEGFVPWKPGEEQLPVFKEIFNYEIDPNDYRIFVENVLKHSQKFAIPKSVQKAKDIVRTIALSSAEAKRGFSKMNIICSEKETPLTISNISNLMT